MSSESSHEANVETTLASKAAVSYAILDQALWNQFRNAASAEEFASAWLALQCRNIDGAAAGVVVLGEADVGPFAPAATWPDTAAVGPELSAAAEQALGKRRAVMTEGTRTLHVAQPILVDERLYGVCAVALDLGGTSGNDALRQLRWGTGWIESLLLRERSAEDQQLRERTGFALDMLASVLEQKRFKAACTALVTELAMRLRCDPVSIGFVRRRRAAVRAVSHAATFGHRQDPIRDTEAAMDEAIDQHAVVLHPAPEGWEYRVSRAHEDLARGHKVDAVLTVPIQSNGTLIGALTFERSNGEGFDDATIELCDAVASVVGPVLDEKRRNDRFLLAKIIGAFWDELRRLLGPQHFGRKLVTVVLAALVAFFLVARGSYEIAAPAKLEGSIQRTVVSPFNGFLASESVRAGAVVRAGQTMATLNDQDLALEQLRLTTTRSQRLTEYDRALAKQDRAEASIIKSQIEQLEAQLSLVDEQLARTRITAPFDGIVVSGDLSQSVGATLERGQELFKIAPLKAYRVILEVDEADIADIEPGQRGRLRVTSLPDEARAYRVDRITPIADQRDGRNFFRVEASLDEADDRLRPSMEGVARTAIAERLLIRIWTRRLVGWARLAAWRWQP